VNGCEGDRVPPMAPPAERLALLRGRVQLAVMAAREGSSRALVEWWASCVRDAGRRHDAAGKADAWGPHYIDAVTASMRGRYRREDGDDRHTSVECTLLHGGDCEDIAAAVATLLELGRVPACLVWLLLPRGRQDHVTVATGDGRDRVMGESEALPPGLAWCEASIPALRGEHPVVAAERLGKAYGRRVFDGR